MAKLILSLCYYKRIISGNINLIQREPLVINTSITSPKTIIGSAVNGDDYNMPLILGSSASLNQSPTILKANTTSIIATPGTKESSGFVNR